jgi:hypothetical protein
MEAKRRALDKIAVRYGTADEKRQKEIAQQQVGNISQSAAVQ